MAGCAISLTLFIESPYVMHTSILSARIVAAPGRVWMLYEGPVQLPLRFKDVRNVSRKLLELLTELADCLHILRIRK
jgi:hypothetical protein